MRALTNRRCVVALALAALLAGCTRKPRAPALIQGDAVYVNAQEGFRFMPPPNWVMYARTELPPGRPSVEEQPLVSYRRAAGGAITVLDVTMEDVPESRDLTEIIKERRATTEWKPAGPVEALEVGGRPAARGAYENVRPKQGPALLKEIVAVRKGGRVYYFTGLFPANDDKSREQVRKSVETLTW